MSDVERRYVVFRPSRYGKFFSEDFWTGYLTPAGNPQQTKKLTRAKLFASAEAAYRSAGMHKGLRVWRVGSRRLELA